jgi:hypothetical protein
LHGDDQQDGKVISQVFYTTIKTTSGKGEWATGRLQCEKGQMHGTFITKPMIYDAMHKPENEGKGLWVEMASGGGV